MCLGPTQGAEKQLLSSNDSAWERRPPPCHPDRSEAQWRDLRFGGSPLEMFFLQSEAQWSDLQFAPMPDAKRPLPRHLESHRTLL
jgi:hypothetical protein